MSGVKISALPAASAANGTDQLEVNQGGTSKRITVDQLNTVTGAGTVTNTSIASANGFAGTVATATTTPAITLSTTVTGIAKGNGTALSAATAGTDYMTPANVSAAYLPLAGGTLTGPVTGTVATFSADVSATEYQFNNVSVVKQFFGGFTGIGDPTNGVGGLHVGATTNYHHNVDHTFQGAGGSPTFVTMNSAGLSSAVPITGTSATFTGNVTHNSALAVGAGAATQAFVKASSTADLGIYFGTGNPSFSAAKGSLYTNTTATTTTTRLWVNTTGSTTWATVTTSA